MSTSIGDRQDGSNGGGMVLKESEEWGTGSKGWYFYGVAAEAAIVALSIEYIQYGVFSPERPSSHTKNVTKTKFGCP